MRLELDPVEQKNLQKFRDELLLKHRREVTIELIITPTGIGEAVTARSVETGETRGITNFEDW